MESSINRLIEYCRGIALEFEGRLNRIRSFVPNHNLTSGTANEVILRNFLAQRSAGRFNVCQGFICDPTNSDLVSKQCDIVVYDHINYPLVYSEGEIKVVFPQAVRMLVEVKTGLSKRDLYGALSNICVAKQMNFTLNGIIFAFQSPHLETTIKNLKEFSSKFPARFAPIAILLLDEGVIIHRWPGTELGGGENPFEVRVCKGKNSGIVIAFLLLLFFDAQMQSVFGGANIYNLMREMLVKETDPVDTELKFTGE
jgi:hypothetical protein